MTKHIVITGTNRGLGLEFVRQYAQENTRIYACCRNPKDADELQTLAKQNKLISIHKLDVTLKQDIENLKKEIVEPIDVFINNAGYLQADTIENATADGLVQSFLVNSIAPLMLAKTFRKQISLSKEKLLVCVSSTMSSLTENTSGGYYSYRASKTALNMLMKSAAVDLAVDNIKVLLLHPGWVKTRMGGENATITADVSVDGMRKLIASYPSRNQPFQLYRYNGEVIPW